MYSQDRYKSTIGFVDLLFNILVGFVFLFLVAFLLINPVAKNADIQKKAEIIITMTWDKNSLHDIDLWVMGPQGNKVGFANKESGLLNLERDDLGVANDAYYIDGKYYIIQSNEETTTVRGIASGDYYVSVHFYSKQRLRDNEINGIPITIKVMKVNPYREVYTQTKKIYDEGESIHFYKFSVSETGGICCLENTDISAVGTIPKFSYRGAGQ